MSQVPLVTLEEHFMSQTFLALAESNKDPMLQMPAQVMERVVEVGARRLASMDGAGVRVQVLSHTPVALAAPASIRAANDELAAHVAAHPDRFRGFAVLAMHEPEAAAAELRRCVGEHGFVGALVDNHDAGRFYDGPEYDAFWSAAQELQVPVYLHPTWPSEEMEAALYTLPGRDGDGADRKLGSTLGAFMWGWHAETGLHVLRLLANGVFDRFPRLKLVVGHSGELLPFQWARIARRSTIWGNRRTFDEVMRANVWITTSGMFDLPSLRCLLSHMPADRVMLSVDYPFSSDDQGRKYVEEIEREGILTGEDLEKFAYKNAETLLGFKS